METPLFKQMLVSLGVFGLLAGVAVAGPQAANTSQVVVAPATTVSALQSNAPTGGFFAPTLLGGPQRPGYFIGTNLAPASGWLGPWPLGGTLYPGPIGGAMNGQIASGGGGTSVIVTGGTPAGSSPGGVLSGRPPGGQNGTNGVGGFLSPSNSLPASQSGVIITGGAQSTGVSSGGAQSFGARPGGVIIVGGSPGTNAPGGQVH
jgi:hypothetical protein